MFKWATSYWIVATLDWTTNYSGDHVVITESDRDHLRFAVALGITTQYKIYSGAAAGRNTSWITYQLFKPVYATEIPNPRWLC